MRNLKYFSLLFATVFALCSCSKDEDSTYIPQTYEREIAVTCEGLDSVVELRDFDTYVALAENYSDWVTLMRELYVEGSPTYHFMVLPNDSITPRETKVVFTSAKGDKLNCSIRQTGYEPNHNKEIVTTTYTSQKLTVVFTGFDAAVKSVSGVPSWVQCRNIGAVDGSYAYEVLVAANNSPAPRSAEIKFESNKHDTHTYTISQAGSPTADTEGTNPEKSDNPAWNKVRF